MFVYIGLLVAVGMLLAAFFFLRKPSLSREWSPDQEVLQTISCYGEYITVHQLRQARYRSVNDYDISHAEHTFKKSDLVRTWLLIEPFGNWLPFGLHAAHVLLSFELSNGTYICVSPEIRKKVGKKFNALKAFLRGYEIMYVLGDERDLIELRTNHRKDDVFLYPLTLDTTQTQELFLNISSSVNSLGQTPQFFNTLTNSCTTNIAHHLRSLGIALPWWHYLYVFPGTLDKLYISRGLIKTSTSYSDTRKKHYITKRAQENLSEEAFSQSIR